jgi:hypothetical protein
MTDGGTTSDHPVGSEVEPTFASLADPPPQGTPALLFTAGPSAPYVAPTRRYVAALVLLLGVVIVAAAATLMLHGRTVTQSSVQTLNAAAFTTSYPSGWTMTPQQSDGITSYRLTSATAPASPVGIPPAGPISQVSAATVALHPLAGGLPDVEAASQTALALLPNVVGTPAGALDDTVTTAAHAETLDGVDAAATSYAYTYAGLANVQSDVVARRGDQIFDAELDSDQELASQGDAALATVIADWRWR